jgi:hypothetical protein
MDNKYLDRIMALLAKAESTTFPAEAEALTGKAQELMTLYAIDAAMLASHKGAGDDKIVVHKVTVPDPYAKAKSYLLNVVAKANGCQSVRHMGQGFSSLVGPTANVEVVEALFASLLTQGASAMLNTPTPPGVNTRSFRQSFLVGYATRIGQRLTEAARASEAEAKAAEPGVGLVLASQHREVAKRFREEFPHTSTSRISSSSGSGRAAGESAANRANLGGSALGGSRHALAR